MDLGPKMANQHETGRHITSAEAQRQEGLKESAALQLVLVTAAGNHGKPVSSMHPRQLQEPELTAGISGLFPASSWLGPLLSSYLQGSSVLRP